MPRGAERGSHASMHSKRGNSGSSQSKVHNSENKCNNKYNNYHNSCNKYIQQLIKHYIKHKRNATTSTVTWIHVTTLNDHHICTQLFFFVLPSPIYTHSSCVVSPPPHHMVGLLFSLWQVDHCIIKIQPGYTCCFKTQHVITFPRLSIICSLSLSCCEKRSQSSFDLAFPRPEAAFGPQWP